MRSMECFDLNKLFSNWRGVLLVLAGLVVLGLVVWALRCIPPWQVEQVRARLDTPEKYEYRLATLEDEYRRTLVQSIGGFFLLVGLYLTWRRIVATEKTVSVAQENLSVAQENVRVAQENVRVAEEGQVTDRFTKAIAQLGDKEIAIRLGGIYALERIAKDSEKDHGPIMEVLTAYVREKAPRREEDIPTAAVKPTSDIQAVLTVIGRRKATEIKRPDDFLDLTHTHLAGVNLEWANLSGLSLYGANLYGANLFGANLKVTALGMADLTRALLIGAKNLTAEQVQSAKSCYKATLPDYLPDSVKDLTNLPPAPLVLPRPSGLA